MMTVEDYMCLPKRRLAEMLVENDDLEDKIEQIVAEKIAELFRTPLTYPIQPTSPSVPNPFQQGSVLYGCSNDTIVYGISTNEGKEQ